VSGVPRVRSILGPVLTRIDHVGIAVLDLDAAVEAYKRLLGRQPSHRQMVESDGIEAVMFEVGESRVELLGSTREDSKIAGFLARRGGGLHHVAYGVDDVQAALDEYAGLGLQTLDSCPRRGAAGRLVAFLHPSAAMGVLTELCQPDPGGTGQST
jgi:methylmalonyl-CoA/ethylmalonyl-CoA epimerase